MAAGAQMSFLAQQAAQRGFQGAAAAGDASGAAALPAQSQFADKSAAAAAAYQNYYNLNSLPAQGQQQAAQCTASLIHFIFSILYPPSFQGIRHTHKCNF